MILILALFGHLLLIIVPFVIATARNIAFNTSYFNETVLQTLGGKIIATVYTSCKLRVHSLKL